MKNNRFIILSGLLSGFENVVNIVNVYAPVNVYERERLWIELKSHILGSNGCWLLMGDFNEIRCRQERFSEVGCELGMTHFNSFISDSALFEFKLGGRRFTWMSEDGKSLSKLDWFLACEKFMDKWGNAVATVLPRRFSDHCPIILINEPVDFGPTPFRFFNSWFC